MPEEWPSPTARDVLLTRVVGRGRRIRLVRNLLTAAAIGGVVAAGAVGYAAGATDTISVVGEGTVTLPDATAAFHACPSSGELGELRRGDRVLLTGRNEDGTWFEVRSPIDLLDRVWVAAPAVTPDAEAELPVVECGLTDEELTLATGEAVVIETSTTSTTVAGETTTTSTTAPPVQPTIAPTQPTVAPTQPTIPPTTAAPQPPPPVPTIGTITRSATAIYEVGDCINEPRTALVSAEVQHATSVTMSWDIGPQPRGKPMSVQAGTASATLGSFPDTTVAASTPITVTIVASGPGGSAQRTTTVTLHDCYFG